MIFVGWGRAYTHSHIILPYKIILLWIYGFYDEHDDDLRKGSKSIYKRNISKEKLSYIQKPETIQKWRSSESRSLKVFESVISTNSKSSLRQVGVRREKENCRKNFSSVNFPSYMFMWICGAYQISSYPL